MSARSARAWRFRRCEGRRPAWGTASGVARREGNPMDEVRTALSGEQPQPRCVANPLAARHHAIANASGGLWETGNRDREGEAPLSGHVRAEGPGLVLVHRRGVAPPVEPALAPLSARPPGAPSPCPASARCRLRPRVPADTPMDGLVSLAALADSDLGG